MEEAFIGFLRSTIPNIYVADSAINRILAEFELTDLEKGEFLLKQGKRSDYFVLLQGHMRAYTYTDQGIEVTTNFFSAPRVVFDPASFFQNTLSQENIVSISQCKGYRTDFDKLNRLFHELPEFREFGRAVLASEFVKSQKQKLSFFTQSADKRYLELLSTNDSLLQVAQLKHIASFLGVTDTSLSRIRRSIAKTTK